MFYPKIKLVLKVFLIRYLFKLHMIRNLFVGEIFVGEIFVGEIFVDRYLCGGASGTSVGARCPRLVALFSEPRIYIKITILSHTLIVDLWISSKTLLDFFLLFVGFLLLMF